jgi:hypothetical protein
VASRSGLKKLVELLVLFNENPAALAADFRSIFNLSIFDMGIKYTYLEAILLASKLKGMPNSYFQAYINKWDYPVSPEYIVLTEVYNIIKATNWDKKKGKLKPYPMPYAKTVAGGKNIGKAVEINKAKELLKKARSGELKFKE